MKTFETGSFIQRIQSVDCRDRKSLSFIRAGLFVAATAFTYLPADGVRAQAIAPQTLGLPTGHKQVVTASGDRTARIWDAANGQNVVVLRGHSRVIRSAAFSPDGKMVVTASEDKTARIWDAETGREIATLEGHENWVNSAAFSFDGRWVVTAWRDGTVVVWNVTNWGKKVTFDERPAQVLSASFSPDSRRILTTSTANVAHIWTAQ